MFEVRAFRWAASGIYVGPNLVITCAHVVRNGAELVQPPLVLPPFRLSGTGEIKAVTESIIVNDTTDIGAVILAEDPWPTWDAPCITDRALHKGEPVTIVSHPAAAYPAVVANGFVSDPNVRQRLDPDPLVSDELRMEIQSIIVHLGSEELGRVTYGSSGGAVRDARGQLVGLVWSGKVLGDGSSEVFVTPASVWLDQLVEALTVGRFNGELEPGVCP